MKSYLLTFSAAVLLLATSCAQCDSVDYLFGTDIPISELGTKAIDKEDFLHFCEGKLYEETTTYYCKREKGEIAFYRTGEFQGKYMYGRNSGLDDGDPFAYIFDEDKIHFFVMTNYREYLIKYNYDEASSGICIESDYPDHLDIQGTILYIDDQNIIIETDVIDGPGMKANSKSEIASWKAEFSLVRLKAVTNTARYDEVEWNVKEY